jgi:hypothetical protein
VSASPTLRVREREILNRYSDVLRDQLAAELGSEPADLRPAVAASAMIAIHQAVIAGYRQGLLGREAVAALERRMLAAASDAFDLIANGVADLAQASKT